MILRNVSYLLFCVLLFACAQTNSTNQKVPIIKPPITNLDTLPDTPVNFDTSKIAILRVDTAYVWLFKNTTSINLVNKDIQTIDRLLSDCINAHNKKQDTTKKFSEYIDLKNYKRQYVPFTNSKGEKKVYVNCFCLSGGNFIEWKKLMHIVDDGGSCFFNVIINLTTIECEQLNVNRSA